MNRIPLTNEQINRLAPSAFAEQPWFEQSERYAFVPTSNVIDSMREHGFFPVQASQSNSRIPGKKFFTKHMLRFSSGNPTVVGDSTLEMVLINAHDGTSRYKLMLGALRLVCENGLVVSEGLAQSISIRHSGDIVDQVLQATQTLAAQAPAINETIMQWKSVELSGAQQIEFALQARALRFEPEMESHIDVTRLLRSRRYNDNGNDLWTVFNRLQENLVRGGVRYTSVKQVASRFGGTVNEVRRNSTRAVTGIDQNIDLNQSLWQLAQSIADKK